MARHVYTLAAMVVVSGLALAQQSQPGPGTTPPVRHDEHEHLSKKEKKEVMKEHDREKRDEKRRLKREAEDRKKEDRQHDKELAKERKRDRDHDRQKENKEIAKEHRDERKHDEKEHREAVREAWDEHPQRSMTGRAVGAATGVAAAPFRVARYATPRLLRAQRDVSRAIYTQLPASNVAVLLNDAGQIVLRGSAPTSSFRSRLLQLAMGAAGGYPIVDQLAADFVGDAASTATSAAIGGVSDVIHGNRNDSGPPPPDNGQYAAAPTPDSAASAGADARAALEPGTSACMNVSSTQVLLTGQAGSQASADLLRQFARQLGGTSATLNDQLATRSTGANAAPTPQERLESTQPNATADGSGASAANPITPGSSVCVNVSKAGEVLLSGTVGSPSEATSVERTAQPLVASARLDDQLTIGSIGNGSQLASGGGTDAIARDTGTPSGSQSESAGVTAEENALEQALHAIPRLSNVDVAVTTDSVRLTGAVNTSQDEQMARDIARQHAGGLSIVDNLMVAGRTPQP